MRTFTLSENGSLSNVDNWSNLSSRHFGQVWKYFVNFILFSSSRPRLFQFYATRWRLESNKIKLPPLTVKSGDKFSFPINNPHKYDRFGDTSIHLQHIFLAYRLGNFSTPL